MHFSFSDASKLNDMFHLDGYSLDDSIEEKKFFFSSVEENLAYFHPPSTLVIFKNLISTLFLLFFHTDPLCCIKFLISPCHQLVLYLSKCFSLFPFSWNFKNLF